MRLWNVNIGKATWILGGILAVIFLIFKIGGERIDGLGITAFVLIMLGFIMDHDAKEQAER